MGVERCPRCGSERAAGAPCPVCLATPGPADGETRDTETIAAQGDASNEGHPDRIGPYRIVDVLGEGGMGIVYLAEQEEPVRRRVALKIIKHGMDSKQVVARFETERQALALMSHPAIARVFDAGVTPNGRPYFVMEHVPGLPVTEYCDRQQLTNRERLDLFRQICEGVQHAHHKAIIHRDLKPSNVLVSIVGGRPMPKIIDFGVAKAVARKLTDKTLHTEMGILLGTPAYMSPEQTGTTGEDVDTRTDVYALGVMLYELLVGALPFDPRELREAGLDAIVRKIRETDPPKPSTRFATLGDRSSESARHRRTQPPALRRELRGDLDWITMKALEKDRARRYGSPQELASDLERYLADQPVHAGPPSAAYRAKKFVRRHTGAVTTAVTGVVVLIAFAATMTVQANRIAAERDRANREAKAKGQVSEFLKNLFRVSDPGEARGNSITARELLDEGAKRIEDLLETEPEIGAELMATMGDVYGNLGLYTQAEPLLERALDERRQTLGKDHPDTLAYMNGLATLYWYQGRLGEAESLHLETLEASRRLLGDDHPDTLAYVNNLANVYFVQGRYDEAERHYLRILDVRRRLLGDEHPDTCSSVNNLAAVYFSQGRYDEAEPLYREALGNRKRTLGEDHPLTLASMLNLAVLLEDQGRYDEAESLYLETLEANRRVHGDDHPDTLSAMLGLAVLYKTRNRYDEAEPLYVETLETSRRVLRDDHPDTLKAMSGLAILYQAQGRLAEAEPLYLETLETGRRVLGDDHKDTLGYRINLANLYVGQGRHAEAEPLYLEALEASERVLGTDHPQTILCKMFLARLYVAQGRFGVAGPLSLEVLEASRRTLGDTHPTTVAALYDLGCLEARRGDAAKALDWLRQSVEAGYDDPDWLPQDTDLASLHGPEFDALIELARQNLGASP